MFAATEPAHAHGGWTPFPPAACYSQTDRPTSRRTATPTPTPTRLARQPSSAERSTVGTPPHYSRKIHHQRSHDLIGFEEPLPMPSPAAHPPSAWRSTPSPVSRHARTSSGGSVCGIRPPGESVASRSGSAQSHAPLDPHASPQLARASSRRTLKGERPGSSTDSSSSRRARIRKSPPPALEPRKLRQIPSKPTLHEQPFNPMTPRPAPSPPPGPSPVHMEHLIRKSMSLDALGNPRSFWDADSERGDDDDDGFDLVEKMRAWSASKLAGGRSSGGSSPVDDEKRMGTPSYGRTTPPAYRTRIAQQEAREETKGRGWRLFFCF